MMTKTNFLTVLLFVVNSSAAQQFDAWRLEPNYNDFEDKHEPAISSYISDPNGNQIGSIQIHYFHESLNGDYGAWVTFMIKGIDGTWPKCDYEYLRYKVDDRKPQYWPKNNSSCPVQTIYGEHLKKLKAGNELTVSLDNLVGVISLRGFTFAWNKAVTLK